MRGPVGCAWAGREGPGSTRALLCANAGLRFELSLCCRGRCVRVQGAGCLVSWRDGGSGKEGDAGFRCRKRARGKPHSWRERLRGLPNVGMSHNVAQCSTMSHTSPNRPSPCSCSSWPWGLLMARVWTAALQVERTSVRVLRPCRDEGTGWLGHGPEPAAVGRRHLGRSG